MGANAASWLAGIQPGCPIYMAKQWNPGGIAKPTSDLLCRPEVAPMLKACSLIVAALSAPLLMPVSGSFAQAADAPQEQAPQAVATSMSKRGNVRFGPSMQSKTVTTLDAGAPVEVLGVAQGVPDWYVIRFPREGSAWIHQKVIKMDESGKKAAITEDRARVRDDARQGGNIVAELPLGDTVEIKERARVGDWIPVYPPSAVAYVHKSVLNVPQEKAAEFEKKDVQGNKLDDVWAEVQARYATFKEALDQNVDVAATLDWEFLDGQLAEVVDGHPSVRVQLAAKRLKDRIAPVVSAAVQVQRANKITPVRDVPGKPVVIAKNDPPATTDKPATDKPATDKPVTEKPKTDPVKPAIDPLPSTDKPKTDGLKEAAQKAPAPAAGGFAAQGFLEERAVPAVGTNHVIIDKNGKICAFVKTKPGVDLQLSEFFWRLVGVKGDSQPVDADKHGQGGGPIPLVLVEDVALLQ
jgi:SH3-like domain-containing protein